MRVLVADDERLARERLERLLGTIPDVEVVAVFATSADALEALRAEAVDLALLDIDMPGLSGLDVAAARGADGPAVVFVTAHPEHALAAFGVGATDYLLKPIDRERLVRALARVASSESTHSNDPLAIRTARGVRLVNPATITHAKVDGETIVIVTGGERMFVEWTLNELERRLPGRFVRVHRRALVALDAIALLEPTDDGGYVARLHDGDTVEVSRAAARGLRRRLGI